MLRGETRLSRARRGIKMWVVMIKNKTETSRFSIRNNDVDFRNNDNFATRNRD